jgi:hypothetical protein
MKGGFEPNGCENFCNSNSSSSSWNPGGCLGGHVPACMVEKCCDDMHARCVIDLVFRSIRTPFSQFSIKISRRRLDMSPGECRICELVIGLPDRFARKLSGTEVILYL